MEMKVQGARKLLRLCTEAPQLAAQKSDEATNSWRQVPVLEQLADHSTLLGVGFSAKNKIKDVCFSYQYLIFLTILA